MDAHSIKVIAPKHGRHRAITELAKPEGAASGDAVDEIAGQWGAF